VTDNSPASERTIDCVAERGRPAMLITVGVEGVEPWAPVVVRVVPAYQWAAGIVWAMLVCLFAAIMRPMAADWPGWLHAGAGLLVMAGGWLLVARLADRLWLRVVESVASDAAEAVLVATAAPSAPLIEPDESEAS
jgi:hypothetical protein